MKTEESGKVDETKQKDATDQYRTTKESLPTRKVGMEMD